MSNRWNSQNGSNLGYELIFAQINGLISSTALTLYITRVTRTTDFSDSRISSALFQRPAVKSEAGKYEQTGDGRKSQCWGSFPPWIKLPRAKGSYWASLSPLSWRREEGHRRFGIDGCPAFSPKVRVREALLKGAERREMG
ncbi:hypothetical protein AVEN_196389-1 [Araneus ventricosus]|uniref:Uncharacterized protein n=1 Tax=Araneus ventricosus TaxID=182803 RepID=A0A4Y2AU58_ARAVE|nr:hypothetical protein AVEN_196389-1 [Araneus ventricosus]